MASKRHRWWIVSALFGSTVINYISRQTFSVLAPVITQELHLSHTFLLAATVPLLATISVLLIRPPRVETGQ